MFCYQNTCLAIILNLVIAVWTSSSLSSFGCIVSKLSPNLFVFLSYIRAIFQTRGGVETVQIRQTPTLIYTADDNFQGSAPDPD